MVGTIQTPDLPQVLRKGWATLRQWVLPERRVQIRPAVPHAPQSTTAALFDSYGKLVNSANWIGRYGLICGRFAQEADQLEDWARQAGATTIRLGQGLIPFEWLIQYGAMFDFMLLDADQIGDADDVTDFCLRLRAAHPSLPVVLVSENVKAHDFSVERSPICDTTLRKPVSRAAFLLGVDSAIRNRALSGPPRSDGGR